MNSKDNFTQKGARGHSVPEFHSSTAIWGWGWESSSLQLVSISDDENNVCIYLQWAVPIVLNVSTAIHVFLSTGKNFDICNDKILKSESNTFHQSSNKFHTCIHWQSPFIILRVFICPFINCLIFLDTSISWRECCNGILHSYQDINYLCLLKDREPAADYVLILTYKVVL